MSALARCALCPRASAAASWDGAQRTTNLIPCFGIVVRVARWPQAPSEVDLMVGGIYYISRGIIAQPRPHGGCDGIWRDSCKGGTKIATI